MKLSTTHRLYFAKVFFPLALATVFAFYSESAAVDATNSHHVFITTLTNAFGSSIHYAGDFNGDGRDDFIIGSPETTPPQEPKAYIFYGPDPSGPPIERAIVNNANVVLTGPSSLHFRGSLFGISVSGGGDFNGDGYDDVIVGAPYAGISSESQEGCAYVFFGQEHSRTDDPLTISYSSADLTICGEKQDDMFGFSVAIVGKMNDDEMDDIVVGAPGFTIAERTLLGKIYAFYGFDTGGVRPVLPATDIDFIDWAGFGMYGYSVAGIGDFNNDGYDDFAVGAPLDAGAGEEKQTGVVYIFARWGRPYPWYISPDCWIIGGQNFGGFGWSVAAAGNVNSDEYDDLIVGAPYMDSHSGDENVGAAYVILGRDDGAAIGRHHMWSPDDPSYLPRGVIQLQGERAYDFFGGSVGNVGDFKIDGFEDFIVGAPRDRTHGTDREGRAYIFQGRAMDYYDFLTVFAGEEGMVIVGEDPEDYFGWSVAGGFQWAQSELTNALIGAPGYDVVYLFRSLMPASPLHGSFPISLQNNTDKIAKDSVFFRKSIDQGTIGFYFTEPEGENEQKIYFWGEAPYEAIVSPGESVTLSVPWPECSQQDFEKSANCSQPSYQASLFWTFKTTIDGKQLYAFPDNTQDPQEPNAPPLLSLAPNGAGENRFQLYAFGDYSMLVGGAKVFHSMPAVAGVKINPKVINLESKSGLIKCLINLPDGLKEKDIEPESLRLSDPTCNNCEPIEALRGYATKKNFTAFFARKDLMRFIKMQQEKRNYQWLRVSGHMKFGNLFEGDSLIHLKRNDIKKKFDKK